MNPSYHSDSAKTPTNPPVPPEVVNTYAPSVPMSVYRELATELQATKAMADSLNGQNQHLARQNQLLRQEIYRVVQTTLQLGQYAGVAQPADIEVIPPASVPPIASPKAEIPRSEIPRAVSAAPSGRVPKPIAKQPQTSSTPAGVPADPPDNPSNSQGVIPQALAIVPKFFTEQSGSKQPYELDADRAKEVSGLWLVLSVILIILTAFGAGFLIMRPLLSDR